MSLLSAGLLASCGQDGGGPAGDDAAHTGGKATQNSGGSKSGDGGQATSGGSVSSSGGDAVGSGGKAAGGSAASSGGKSGSSGGADPAESGGNAASGSGGSQAGGSGGSGGGGNAASGSPGCGKAPVESGKKTIQVGTDAREYILKVPDNYDPNHPYRLILGYHGRMYDAEWVANGEPPLTGPYFGMESEAKGQAIFVATQALSTSWSNQNGRDINYTKQIVEELSDSLCIDKDRIFATGFSYGAIMTIRIGCELAGTFRAIAPMSGSLMNGCPENPKQVAYWASHGLQDTTILPALGEEARDEFIKRNHCSAESDPSEPAGCVKYRDCDDGYPVSFCTFEGEHEPAPFAGVAIWPFFAQF